MRYLALIVFLFSSTPIYCGSAPAAPLPLYVCHRAVSPVKIDGRLDEDAWKAAESVSLVVFNGTKPTRPTTAKICWDDLCLYIAFDAEDPDIWGTMKNRDDLIFREEVVEAFIDTDNDPVHYYEFNISPRNVVFDSLITNATGRNVDSQDSTWNCRWLRTAVAVDGTLDDRSDTDHRWTVELAIPFTSLNGKPHNPPKPGDRWEINLYRIDLTPKPEFSCWSPTLTKIPIFHTRPRFGMLIFADP